MKKYYHWTSWDLNNISEGMITGTHWKESNYWAHKKTMTGPEIEIPETIKGLFPESFQRDISKLKYEVEFRKEEVFEAIRVNEFSELPSRKLCLFAISSSIDPYEFGKRIKLHIDRYNLIEIRPVQNYSKVHQSKMSLLNCNGSSAEEMQEIARTYWSGEGEPSFDTEVLIDGEIEIINTVNLKEKC